MKEMGERRTTINRETPQQEFSFPRLIVVPLSSHAVDGVRKEKERLTAAWRIPFFSPFVMTSTAHDIPGNTRSLQRRNGRDLVPGRMRLRSY